MLPRGSSTTIFIKGDDREPDEDGLFSTAIAALDHVGRWSPDINFKKLDVGFYVTNPVVLYGHERWDAKAVVARTERMRWMPDGKLWAWFRFVEDNEVADIIRRAWEQRALNAASISVSHKEDGREQMLEWSIVPVPADQLAVARADVSADTWKQISQPITVRSMPTSRDDKVDDVKVVDTDDKG